MVFKIRSAGFLSQACHVNGQMVDIVSLHYRCRKRVMEERCNVTTVLDNLSASEAALNNRSTALAVIQTEVILLSQLNRARMP